MNETSPVQPDSLQGLADLLQDFPDLLTTEMDDPGYCWTRPPRPLRAGLSNNYDSIFELLFNNIEIKRSRRPPAARRLYVPTSTS
jgi:hypothetical protein